MRTLDDRRLGMIYLHCAKIYCVLFVPFVIYEQQHCSRASEVAGKLQRPLNDSFSQHL